VLLSITLVVLLLATLAGYYFGGKQGALGSFLTTLFLFGLPVLVYVTQVN